MRFTYTNSTRSGSRRGCRVVFLILAKLASGLGASIFLLLQMTTAWLGPFEKFDRTRRNGGVGQRGGGGRVLIVFHRLH